MLLLVYKSKVAFFMATTQTFETIVSLNAQQAKNEMATLKKALDDLKQKKAEALKDPGTSVKDINKFDKQIKAAEASLKSYSNSVAKTIDTVNNISTASLGDIEKAAREVRRAMKQVTNPDDYNALNVILQHCKDRMDFLKDSTVHSLKEMQELNHATVNLQRVLGDINGASLNDLTAAASTLQKELNDMSPNTDAFDKASESLQKINTRIQQIHSSQKEANLSIDKYDSAIVVASRGRPLLVEHNVVKKINDKESVKLVYVLYAGLCLVDVGEQYRQTAAIISSRLRLYHTLLLSNLQIIGVALHHGFPCCVATCLIIIDKWVPAGCELLCEVSDEHGGDVLTLL